MSVKIYITGNFLVAEEPISRNPYFKVALDSVHHFRDGNDNFAFFGKGTFPILQGQPQVVQLGVQPQWKYNEEPTEQQNVFPFSDILDENGLAYASADILDQLLNDNLGKSSTEIIITPSTDLNIYDNDGTISDLSRLVRLNTSDATSSLTFEKLDGTDILTIAGDGTVGIGVTPNANYLTYISTGSVERALMVFNSKANGQAIRGQVSATSGANYAGIFKALGVGATANRALQLEASGATNNFALDILAGSIKYSQPTQTILLNGATSGDTVAWSNGTSDVMTIAGNSTIGIGVAPSPSFRLFISGSTRTSGNHTQDGTQTQNGDIQTQNLGQYKASFPTNYNVVQNSSLLAQTPMAWVWHDIFAFDANYNCTYETSLDNVTFTPATLDTLIFSQKQDQTITYLTGASINEAVRWNFTNVQFNNMKWLSIGFAYESVVTTKQVIVESSVDAIVWTTRHDSEVSTSANNIFFTVQSHSGDTYYRVTIVNKTAGGMLKLSCLKGLTDRPGDQGQGSEQSFPYYWDKEKNIRIGGTNPLTSLIGSRLDVFAETSNDNALNIGLGKLKFSQAEQVIEFNGNLSTDKILYKTPSGKLNLTMLATGSVFSSGASSNVNNLAYGNGCFNNGTATGSNNTAVGNSAMLYLSNGGFNTGIGDASLFNITSGYSNMGLGYQALYFISSTNSNVGVGSLAGKNISTGGINTGASDSLYLGFNTKPLGASQSNQIVIGSEAIGNGSNTTTLGKGITTDAYLHGKVHSVTNSGNDSQILGDYTNPQTVNFTANYSDVILATGGVGGITIKLPTLKKDAKVRVKKIDSGVGAITITGVLGTELIDGQTSQTISTQYDSYTFICDGSAWYII